MLSLEGVRGFYGDFQALFDVSLSVEEGETAAIIGANGAGKSTLLAAIAGSLARVEGAIRFDGSPIDGLPPHARVGLGISLVPEGRRIFPSLSVEENLLLGAYTGRPGPWDTTRVYELFPLLARVAGSPGARISGGEQQALAIGRALMANPRLLLLDEVSLGLAPIVVGQLYAAMPEIAGLGTTILLVEQDVGQALGAAARVYCLLEGRVSLQGRPGELASEQITVAYFGV
ncbi:MAG: ABC transporter ATP-binding protein [Thermoleophilia bacterium]|nr:ABC transporter ATP-binding protein [Thermoleophilia bacterium]